jgi:hypothetical protein
MAVPTVVVEFDANPPQATEFILDVSALDGGDQLATSPRWVNIGAVTGVGALSGTVTRGRQNIDSPVQAGELVLVCDNFGGDFDPDNPLSDFNLAPPGLVKGMLVHVLVTYGAITKTIFQGRLDSVTLDKGYNLSATFTFVDELTAVGSSAMASFNTAVRPETSFSRASWLLTFVPPISGGTSVSTNLTKSLLPTYGGSTVLDHLNLVATAEAGRVFIDRFGKLTVTAHADDLTGASVATFTDHPTDVTGIQFEALITSPQRIQVINGAIVDRYNRSDSNYASVFGGDAGSAAIYGQTVISYVAPLSSDVDAQSLADYYGTRRAIPKPTIDGVAVNFSGQSTAAAGVPALLGADLGDQVTVHRTVPYIPIPQVIDEQALIEGLRYEFATGQFRGTYYLAPSDVSSLFGGAGPFTLDISALDGTDVLAAY